MPVLLALAKIECEVYALSGLNEGLRRLQALAPGHLEVRLLGAGSQCCMGDDQGHLASL